MVRVMQASMRRKSIVELTIVEQALRKNAAT
jgi:hypothetical protein